MDTLICLPSLEADSNPQECGTGFPNVLTGQPWKSTAEVRMRLSKLPMFVHHAKVMKALEKKVLVSMPDHYPTHAAAEFVASILETTTGGAHIGIETSERCRMDRLEFADGSCGERRPDFRVEMGGQLGSACL